MYFLFYKTSQPRYVVLFLVLFSLVFGVLVAIILLIYKIIVWCCILSDRFYQRFNHKLEDSDVSETTNDTLNDLTADQPMQGEEMSPLSHICSHSDNQFQDNSSLHTATTNEGLSIHCPPHSDLETQSPNTPFLHSCSESVVSTTSPNSDNCSNSAYEDSKALLNILEDTPFFLSTEIT